MTSSNILEKSNTGVSPHLIEWLGTNQVYFGGYIVRWGQILEETDSRIKITSISDLNLDRMESYPIFYHYGQDPDIKRSMLGYTQIIYPDKFGVYAIGVFHPQPYKNYPLHKTMFTTLINRKQLEWRASILPLQYTESTLTIGTIHEVNFFMIPAAAANPEPSTSSVPTIDNVEPIQTQEANTNDDTN